MDKVDVAKEIERLLMFALKHNIIDKHDIISSRNALMDLLQLKEPYEGEITEEILKSPIEMLESILDYAAEKGILPDNTVSYRDLLDTRIMGLLMPRQSEVSRNFWQTSEQNGIKTATDNFYKLSQHSNYIRMDRIAKNLYWRSNTEYGSLEITINLSKPEKDPKDIEEARKIPNSNYPKCLLCLENVGYAGNLNHPARQNHRVIPVNLNNEQWYFQYSPYVYYNEHCIVFNEKHIPMKISEKTFYRLADFIEQFPHYFVGSNADIPIVGGSILVHDHFQGGCHVFPMEEARIEKRYNHELFKDVNVGILKWPLSVVRISGYDRDKLIKLADEILNSWKEYCDYSVDIISHTKTDNDLISHNTITPIARKNNEGQYEFDLVLRNNRTSEEHPEGIFHPHRELHHIKKENIGLIEVMGLAVLPGRLQSELGEIEKILTGDTVYSRDRCLYDTDLSKHVTWIEEIIKKYGTDMRADEAEKLLKQEVGAKFLNVLSDAGVFKRDDEGKQAFNRFLMSLGFKQISKDYRR